MEDDNARDSVREDTGNKTDKTNYKTTETAAAAHGVIDEIAADCGDILALLQSIAVKDPRVKAAPLSLHADKRVQACFHF